MIRTSSIVGQSGIAYTVFDFPIVTWREFPVKGIFLLTKMNKGKYHEIVAIGESENVSQTLKAKQMTKKAHCLYILFAEDHYRRMEILSDIEKALLAEKKKMIFIKPQEAKTA